MLTLGDASRRTVEMGAVLWGGLRVIGKELEDGMMGLL